MNNKYPHKELTYQIINLALKVHKSFGPGFVEKIYQRALYIEFKKNKVEFEREKKLRISYKNINIGYEKVDFIIANTVIVELKAVSEIQDLHKAQIISYLKSSGCKVGLLLNFAKPKLEIKRVIY